MRKRRPRCVWLDLHVSSSHSCPLPTTCYVITRCFHPRLADHLFPRLLLSSPRAFYNPPSLCCDELFCSTAMDKGRPGFPSNSSSSSSSSSYASSSPSSNHGGIRKKTEIFSMLKCVAGLHTWSTHDNTGKGRSKLPGNRVTHGFHLVKGKSGHNMEDYHVAEYTHKDGHELGLFAIFDGHLGDSVPSYLKTDLFPNIINQPDFWNDTETAIRNAYRYTNGFILENSTRMGPGGSTAVTAIVIDGKDLWIANIGDSRAVLCERGSANQLTVDHEPHVERERIEKQGGFVTLLPGDVSRVNGQLAVARAFGDQGLKEHLSAEPDVRHVPIDSTIQFVILASDGLWKVMENHEAVNLVKTVKDPQAAAKRLTTEALARKSTDDISCIVIRFRSSEPSAASI